MGRVYNFSAGPAVLREEVLKEAADEMLDYRGTGMSVMEMSHRSKAYEQIINEAEQDLRDLMNIPDNYKVLFLQGGASQQFAMIPMNLMKNKVAEAMGATAFRITDKNEVETTLRKALEINGPVVIECVLDCDDKVWPMVAPGAAISEVFSEEDLQNSAKL